MNFNASYISLYDLLLCGMLSVALAFTGLLGFAQGTHRPANRFLALALFLMLFRIARQLVLTIRLPDFLPEWLAVFALLSSGPLSYFYVRKTIRPVYRFGRKDLLHLSPVLAGLGTCYLQSIHSSGPVAALPVWGSAMLYLFLAYRQLQDHCRQQALVLMDRSRLKFRWLRRLLAVMALWWCLWLVSINTGWMSFYPFLAVMVTGIALAVHLRPHDALTAPAAKPVLRAESRSKAIWLKQEMRAGRYHQDPQLTLTSLAEKLGLSTHELSRIINSGLKKSFPEFINGYRVAEVIRKMRDPAYDRLNLAGIAYDSGFSSKSTFHRIFKDLTGKSPADYKDGQEKELPVYKLRPGALPGAVFLRQETISKWSDNKLNRNFMFRNYLKVSLRFLLKNRFFSLLNITGLAAGTLCCLYILLYVQDQYSYDRHHKDAATIYRVTTSLGHTGDVNNMATASPPIAPAMKYDFPEVQQYTRVIPTLGISEHLLSYQDKAIYEQGAIMVDSTFFKVFTYHFTQGSPENAFTDVNSIVLLKPVADKLFGSADPVGKVITIDDADGKNIFKVTGVVDESAGKSQIKANLFIRLNKNGYGGGILTNNSWAGNNFTESYVRLRADANVSALEKKLPAFLNKYGADQLKSSGMSKSLHLQPLTSVHTTPGYNAESGKIVSTSFLYVLILIAVLIQLIACINFMNLSTARASQRAKEVGVRKVIGAGKYDLITQFLGESFLLSFIGVLIALPLLWLALPYLNQITQASIRLSFFGDVRLLLLLGGLVLFTGLAAGGYPAFYMSAFKAIKVIKGNFTSQFSTQVLRRSLVVFQFVISIILITGVIIIYSQLNYIKNRDLGFDKDQQIILTFHTNDTKSKMNALATGLGQLAGVRSISRVSNTFGAEHYFDWGVYLSGMNPAEAVDQQNLYADEHFVQTMGLKLAAGRNLMAGDSGKVLINEALAKRLSLAPEKAPGVTLFSDGDRKFQVAGIVKDFNFRSLHDNIDPFMIIYAPKAQEVDKLILNTDTKDYAAFLAKAGQVWHQYLPQTPFDYTFMNDRMQSAYENDIVLSQIINSFTLIAILISCLGLFGLTAFSAEQRNKEIGIRKVLGASVSGIVRLLSKDFLRLVLIAFVIAAPLAWWAMSRWLQGFVYRVGISWWMFALAAAAALVIAVLTVSVQAVKAAVANPVKSLRSE
ncbi:ABC transporter permease [Mucilaginibacter ginsenosidivorax]|uniref:FtsX-like permease family protein n=1 Tax=Mucilaginibacter ginsenosidivorax TaxID=862126 RepID=A0A5B8W3F9_9SPHI|nr:ABC transporter permease [Mucilaginibacter ginsenosidivorax]QEC78600.1 FtsX-like permease family protein [Mucilaginibacter ginsenosidivorax]